MRVLASFLIALRALRRNKMRSILTALGIIIGVGAVIVVFGLGTGAKAQVQAQVASLGQNIVSVFPGTTTSGGMRGGWGSASTLTVEDAEAIRYEVAGILGVSPDVRDRQQVLANGLNWNTSVQGSSPDFVSIRNWTIESGDVFTEQDVRSAAKVCVIGKTVADQLFPGSDPVGQMLRIRNLPFRVLAVLGPKGFNYFGQDQDDTVIVPYTSAMKRITRRDRINSITIAAASEQDIPLVQESVTELLTQRRQGREPDFTVRTQIELAQSATETTKTMRYLLAGVSFVSLLVGGIGVMNIMLVSVTERTREIGIRAAVGARGNDVLMQFLIEAVVLTLLGGLLGVGAGMLSAYGIKEWLGWAVVVPWWAIIGSFFVTGLVGVVFGFFPAMKAAALDPIEALRFE
jgi:putative ABC transport system permease protein